MRRVSTSLAVCLLGLVSLAPAQVALPKGVQRNASVEGITEYQLSNGLRVLLFPDPSKQTATVNITYLVGSRHESYGETGMAHLLEHLVFKGSPRHQNIPQELTAHGARPNGTTWYDRTNYFETFAATDENLNWALDLESDRMVNSFIAKKDLDSEMTVVRNEFEMGENSPGRVLFERVLSTAYLWHNYGKSTIGSRADVEHVPIDRLQAFYKKYYQPDNAILAVAGKIDEAKTLALVEKYFGPIPRPARKLEPTYTLDPPQDGERIVTLKRVGDVQEILAAYHIPSGADPDFAAVEVLSEVLGDVPSGRLHKALVEGKKATSANGGSLQLREPGVAIFSATVRKEQSLDDAKTTMLKVLDDISKEPPSKEEVERIKTKMLKQIELSLNNSESVGLNLSEWASMGDWRLLFLQRDRLAKVTPDDVARVAKKYLVDSNRTLGVFIPTTNPVRAEIAPPADVAAIVKDYKGNAAVAQGEFFDPSPANIDSRVQRSTLPNGMQLILLPKKTRGNTVSALIRFHLGDEQSLQNKLAVSQLTAGMLLRGTEKMTRQQIQDEFDKLKARVGVNGAGQNVNATVETVRANLPATLKLLMEVLRQASFPDREFDQLKQQTLAQIEQGKSEPTVMAQTALVRHMQPFPKGDIRYTSTPEERTDEVKSVTREQVIEFYKRFYGSNKADFVVIGDFEPAEIQPLANAMTEWKNQQTFTRVMIPYRAVEALNKSFPAPDKANAFFMAGLPLALSDESPDYPALTLANYILGGGFLNSRLATRIRQKEGLSYGVGSMLEARPKEESGQFVSYAIYAPQNVNKLEKAFREEIERSVSEGFTADEVEQAKKGWLQSREVSRAQDRELMNTLAARAFYGRTMAYDAELERKVGALTPAQLQAAMKKYIDPAKISIIKAGDWQKAGVTP